jgi:hypothetical protein
MGGYSMLGCYRIALAAAAVALLLGSAIRAAVAQPTAGRGAAHKNTIHADDVPPGLHARGAGGAPLALSISGLKSGYARVGAGSRMFGVCWSGGNGPYEVTLRDADGGILLDEAGLGPMLNELIKSSAPVLLRPGVYSLDLADSAGAHALGNFTVVDPSSLPAAGGVRAAQSLSQTDLTLSYEAYLRVLPLAHNAPQSDAAALVNQLCHQSS